MSVFFHLMLLQRGVRLAVYVFALRTQARLGAFRLLLQDLIQRAVEGAVVSSLVAQKECQTLFVDQSDGGLVKAGVLVILGAVAQPEGFG